MTGFISNLSIRSKLLYGYSCAFVFALAIGSFVLFLNIRTTIEKGIEHELSLSTQSILNLITTAADASINNHLRAVAEKNKEITASFYQRFLDGKMSEQDAKNAASKIILSQTIGTTGYIYVIDSEGIIQVHPEQDLNNVDLSGNHFIQLQKNSKEGYLEYDWANPGEGRARPKALYMSYFKPWDWIIAASSYRDEFTQLFSLDDFRDNVLSLTFGKTGYPYVMDSKGLLLIHPQLEGTNIYQSTDSSGRMFIKEICETKNGKIIYPWKNPGEPESREKLVIFNYIPEYDWIVASSSYLEEFYEPLKSVAYATVAMAALLLIMLLPITWWISTSISKPIALLITGFKKGADGDYSDRLETTFGGEVSQLANYYNIFMTQLEQSRHNLHVSAKNYRELFENAVEGIYQTTPDGRLLSANPSLAHILGYESPEDLLKAVSNIGTDLYVDPNVRKTMLEHLGTHGTIIGYEAQMYRRNKSIIWASLNARGTKDHEGTITRIEGFITDVTQRRDVERSLRKAKEELEIRVEERTTELSNHISRLKRRNAERASLQEMINMVQLCSRPSETYPVVERFMADFFPEETVSLFIKDNKTSELDSVFSQNSEPSFTEDDCWALRQGKSYLLEPSGKRPRCSHASAQDQYGSLCVPLTAHNEIIGLLHIKFLQQTANKGKTLRLANNICDQLGLAIANLSLRESLRLQSIQDPLTGLFNRRYLSEAIARELARAKRKNRSFAFVMIDVDHFKVFNDNHGHDVGDQVLRALSDFLIKNIRTEDIPCRFGGEEFALILHEVTEKNALGKVNELCQNIRENVLVSVNGEELRITASIGVALYPQHGTDEDALVKAADEALYRAKDGGRNQAVMAE